MLALARRYPWVAPASARVGLATGATVLSLLAADNAYWVAKRWAARRAPDEVALELDTQRLALSVQRYYPTAAPPPAPHSRRRPPPRARPVDELRRAQSRATAAALCRARAPLPPRRHALWNDRGQEAVAELIAAHMFGR